MPSYMHISPAGRRKGLREGGTGGRRAVADTCRRLAINEDGAPVARRGRVRGRIRLRSDHGEEVPIISVIRRLGVFGAFRAEIGTRRWQAGQREPRVKPLS